MKNEKIINSLNKIKSSDETKEQIFNDILQKHESKRRTFKPAKIFAMAAAVVLIVGLFNITTVVAFIKGLLFVPGVGFTDDDLQVVVLNEPVDIECDWGKVTLEFVTKVRRGDKCEILLYFNSMDKEFFAKVEELNSKDNTDGTNYMLQELSAKAIINNEVYDLNSGGTGASINNGAYSTHITNTNNDFPDINEFELQFRDTTTHIVLTELTPEEKVPYTSEEINGITLAAYKFRNNNRLISVDVINNNDLGEFYSGTPDAFFNTVTGENDTEIQVIGGSAYSFTGWAASKGNGFGYYIKHLDNVSNAELTGIKNADLPGITIEYFSTLIKDNVNGLIVNETRPSLTLPIPGDGETIKTDIKIPVGGAFYEVTEVRREGDVIYFKDNDMEKDMPPDFDMNAAVKNNEVYVFGMKPLHFYAQGGELTTVKVDINDNSITGFNPDDTSLEIYIRSISVIYLGDFSVDLTQK